MSRHLTPRERDIAEALLGGLCNKEIAQRCGTALNTVKGQLSALYARFGVRTRTQLAMLVLQENLLAQPLDRPRKPNCNQGFFQRYPKAALHAARCFLVERRRYQDALNAIARNAEALGIPEGGTLPSYAAVRRFLITMPAELQAAARGGVQ